MSSSTPRAPQGLETSGRRLWKSVTSRYELLEHEQLMLREACCTADICAQLQAAVVEDGGAGSGAGHPALVELRMQRWTLVRILRALQIPVDEEGLPR